MLLIVIALLSCLCFLCKVVSISVITLISPGSALAIALLLIALVATIIIQILANRDVHHTRLLLLIRLLIIVEILGGGSLVFGVVGHATDILWLIVPITTPVIALFLIIRLADGIGAVAAKHALLGCLRAKFTFTSTTFLRGLTL